MGWHYVAVKHVYDDGDVEYALHEAYSRLQSWTESPVSVWGDTPAELARQLRAAADDVEKYAPIEDSKWPEEKKD